MINKMKYAVKLVKNPCGDGSVEGYYYVEPFVYEKAKYGWNTLNEAYRKLEEFWALHKRAIKEDCGCIFEVEEYEE